MYKKSQLHFHLMMTPGVIAVFLFNTMTLLGICVAFQDFIPNRGWFGSKWVGFKNFELFFGTPDAAIILRNTLVMAVGKIICTTVAAIVFAILLSEIKSLKLKRIIQTSVYFPHFVSWVIFASIIRFLLGSEGMINHLLQVLGVGKPILFLSSEGLFQPLMIATEMLKEFGYSSIIYLAAIVGISPILYEASKIDGASRFKMIFYITLPCIMPTIILLATLSIGDVLNAGFDQVFNLYNPAVYSTADIIDTYVYRVGLMQINFGLGSAIGLFKSVVSFILIIISYMLASKFADYRIF